MKALSTTRLLTAIFALGLLTGCPPNDTEVVEPAPTEPEEPEVQRLDENGSITITGDDQMRFDPTEFAVEAGQSITIIFENIGQLPKEAMGHNLVVLEQGVDPVDFAVSSAGHPGNEYVDPEREDEVIAFTPILGPDEDYELSFEAPEEPGEYDYICSFPGHTQAGMVGVMIVE